MEEVGEWFRWIVGIVVGIMIAVIGWGATMINTNRNSITKLDSRIVAIESRPTVDPIDYTKAITQMATALANLTDRLADQGMTRAKQYQDLLASYQSMRDQVSVLQAELDVAVGKIDELTKKLSDKGFTR